MDAFILTLKFLEMAMNGMTSYRSVFEAEYIGDDWDILPHEDIPIYKSFGDVHPGQRNGMRGSNNNNNNNNPADHMNGDSDGDDDDDDDCSNSE